MTTLYTIGFTHKSAETFFNLLLNSGVKKIIDIRIHNTSQLAGFAKGTDLSYLAKVHGMRYEHHLEFAPSKELFTMWRAKKLTWAQYEEAYLNLLESRNVVKNIDIEGLNMACLLCSEHKPESCHRRLLAEYLQKAIGGIDIVHLI